MIYLVNTITESFWLFSFILFSLINFFYWRVYCQNSSLITFKIELYFCLCLWNKMMFFYISVWGLVLLSCKQLFVYLLTVFIIHIIKHFDRFVKQPVGFRTARCSHHRANGDSPYSPGRLSLYDHIRFTSTICTVSNPSNFILMLWNIISEGEKTFLVWCLQLQPEAANLWCFTSERWSTSDCRR